MTYLEREGLEAYILPEEQKELEARWWRVCDCARKWGVSWDTAKRYMLLLEDCRWVMLIRTGGAKAVMVVPADSPLPEVERGNPCFHDGAWQREQVMRRWHGAPEAG